MSNKIHGKDFFIGAVVGGVLGALTALVLAPKTGKELRSDISEQYDKISEKTVEIAGTVGTKTQEIAKTVSVQTGEIVDKAKEVAGVVVGEVKAWKDSRREAIYVLEDTAPAAETAEAAVDSEVLAETAAAEEVK
jgi:gas vesicle protein